LSSAFGVTTLWRYINQFNLKNKNKKIARVNAKILVNFRARYKNSWTYFTLLLPAAAGHVSTSLMRCSSTDKESTGSPARFRKVLPACVWNRPKVWLKSPLHIRAFIHKIRWQSRLHRFETNCRIQLPNRASCQVSD